MIIRVVARGSGHQSAPEEYTYHAVPAVGHVCAEKTVSDLYHDTRDSTLCWKVASRDRKRLVTVDGGGIESSA